MIAERADGTVALHELPHGLGRFRSRAPFRFDAGGFTVKTADGPEELLKALRLRHDVFFAERLGRRLPGGVDADAFDAKADHVLVLSPGGEVVATYRLLCSLFVASFYSESEFDLDSFMAVPGTKLELGRACTAPAWRGGAALALVWKGLARYARRAGARFLFGTTSVDTASAADAGAVLAHLRSTGWTDAHLVRPRPGYAFDEPLGEGDAEAGRLLVPPLLRSYLRAGARVHGLPALDRDFVSADFFTVLDLEAADRRFAARFFCD